MHVKPFFALGILLVLCVSALPVFAEDAATAVSLAVAWKATLLHPLPPAANMDGAHVDAGISPEATAAVAVNVADEEWESHQLPNGWESFGGAWATADGEAVFRVTIDLPVALVGHDLELRLGAIDDFDTTYVNGEAVGHTDKSVLGYWAVQRAYRVPATLAHAGKMVIAVRVFDQFAGGGFTGPKEQMVLKLVQ